MRVIILRTALAACQNSSFSPQSRYLGSSNLEGALIQRVTFTLTLKETLLQGWMLLRMGLIFWLILTVIAILSQLFHYSINHFLYSHLTKSFTSMLQGILFFLQISAICFWSAIGFFVIPLSIFEHKRSNYLKLDVQIDENGVKCETRRKKYSFSWSDVRQISETSYAMSIQMKLSKRNSFIPRRAFEGDAQGKAFHQAACEYWAKHKET